MPKKNARYVIRNPDGGWAVKGPRSGRASGVFDNPRSEDKAVHAPIIRSGSRELDKAAASLTPDTYAVPTVDTETEQGNDCR